MSEDTFPEVLKRLATRVQPKSIVDVGSSDGRWSRMAMEFWPDAKYVLIEADNRHEAALMKFCEETGANSVHMMAGRYVGMGHFASDPNDPWGGQGRLVAGGDTKETASTTIDNEILSIMRPYSPPYLIKLDTHGFEEQILLGAEETLKNTCALVIEAYTCELQPGAMRFWELCGFLERRGFIPTDIAEPMRRPLDGRLWQFDIIWERADAPMVGESRYK